MWHLVVENERAEPPVGKVHTRGGHARITPEVNFGPKELRERCGVSLVSGTRHARKVQMLVRTAVMKSKKEEYRVKAAECGELAAQAPTDEIREELLKLACMWLWMAVDEESRER
jgi:hypothetical protein